MSDMEMLQLRKVEASTMAPRAAGRSLTATLLINDHQSWKAAVAPIMQLARAVWQASVNRNHHGMSLSEILRAWGAAQPMSCLAQLKMGEAVRAAGLIGHPLCHSTAKLLEDLQRLLVQQQALSHPKLPSRNGFIHH